MKRITIILLMLILSVCLFSNADYAEGRLIFKTYSSIDSIYTNQDSIAQIGEAWFDCIAVDYGIFKLYPIVETPADSSMEKIYICEFPDSISCDDVRIDLEKEKEKIVYALYDLILYNFWEPDDEHYSQQWNLEKIGMEDVWNDPYLWNGDVNVAVYDSGIDCADPDTPTTEDVHPDITGQILTDGQSNMVYYFPDQTGYPYPWDTLGHGTWVSGIINALTNNEEGVASICGEDDKVKILPMKHLDDEPFLSGLLQGCNWLYDRIVNNFFVVDILNISMGSRMIDVQTQNYHDLCDIMGAIMAEDVIIVASAGNNYEDFDENSNVTYVPGSINGVLRIASSDNDDELSYFSNHGSDIFVSAPGSDIISTVPHHDNYGCQADPYEYKSGTSASAPHVSGMLALLKSHYTTYTNAQLLELIDLSSDDMVLAPWEMGKTGSGRINIREALNIDLAETNANYVISHLDFEGADVLYNTGVPIETDIQFVNYGDNYNNVTITGEFSAPGLTFDVDEHTYWEADVNGVFAAHNDVIQDNWVTVSFGAATERNTVMTFVFTATDASDDIVYCDTLYADVQLFYTGWEYLETVTTDLLIEDLDQDEKDEVIYGLKHITPTGYEGRLVCLNDGTMSHATLSDTIYLKPVAADLNSNGDKEIVVVTKRNTSMYVHVFDSDLDLIVSRQIVGEDVFGLLIEDIEDDGDLEIITNTNLASGDARIQIILDVCTSPTVTTVDIEDREWISSIAAANVNEDLFKEVVGVLASENEVLSFGILGAIATRDTSVYTFKIKEEGEIEPDPNHTSWAISNPVLAKNLDTGNVYHHLFINIWEFCFNTPNRNGNNLYCFDLTDASEPVWLTDLTCYIIPVWILRSLRDLVVGDYTDDSGLEILVSSCQRVVNLEDGLEIQYFIEPPGGMQLPLWYEAATITNVNQDSKNDMIGFLISGLVEGIGVINTDQNLVYDQTFFITTPTFGNIISGGIGWDGTDWKYYYIHEFGVLSDIDLDLDRNGLIEWSQKGDNARSTFSYYQPIPEEIEAGFDLDHDALIDYNIEITNTTGAYISVGNGTEMRFEKGTKIDNYGYFDACSSNESEPIIITGMCPDYKANFWSGINNYNRSDYYMTYGEYANSACLYMTGAGTRKIHFSDFHHNKSGIFLYNNADVILFGNDIEDNDIAGIRCYNNSTITIGPYSVNDLLGFNNINDNDYGIELYSSSVLMRRGYNNLDQTNDSFNIKLASGAVTPAINVEDNWWGSTNTNTIESLFNFPGSFDYDPYSTSINTLPTRSDDNTILEEAVIASNNENYEEAILLYQQILTDSIYCWEDNAALNGLFYCSEINSSLDELDVWLNEYDAIDEVDFDMEIERISALILRCNGSFDDAISVYEELLAEEPGYEDSCYCIIDIGDTYFESEMFVRSGYLRDIPADFDEYVIFRTQLLDSIGEEKEDDNQIIAPLTLKAIYPNPFNPITNISFSLKSESSVKIDVYNIKGQHVKTIFNDMLGDGEHNVIWNGTNKKDNVVGSGVYFVRLRAGNESIIQKIACIK